jgi:hypothetical protein
MFIELSPVALKRLVFINSNHIVAINDVGEHTDVHLSDGTTLQVVEKALKIAEAINVPVFFVPPTADVGKSVHVPLWDQTKDSAASHPTQNTTPPTQDNSRPYHNRPITHLENEPPNEER